MSATSGNTNFASNTPFVVSPIRFGACNAQQRTVRAPFDMLGYQCTGVNNSCGTVNQFTYEPGAPMFYSGQQCASQCGGAALSVYMPGRAI